MTDKVKHVFYKIVYDKKAVTHFRVLPWYLLRRIEEHIKILQ
jgi:hypothetical protein